jgi:hypothetical protein
VISEAFWLREVGALQSSANDMIRLSEVITSERFGPVGSKYRESACGANPADREHVGARADRGMINHRGRSATRCANVPYA